MKIEVDYKIFETTSKSIAKKIGDEGLNTRLKSLNTSLADMQAAWQDEENSSHIKALTDRINNLQKMKHSTEAYLTVLNNANTSYKKIVETNLNIVKNL